MQRLVVEETGSGIPVLADAFQEDIASLAVVHDQARLALALVRCQQGVPRGEKRFVPDKTRSEIGVRTDAIQKDIAVPALVHDQTGLVLALVRRHQRVAWREILAEDLANVSVWIDEIAVHIPR